jgi:hypothetical protein
MQNLYSNKTISNETKAAIDAERSHVQIDYEKSMIETAFKHRYRLTPAEQEVVQRLFPRRYVIADKPNKDSSHPVLGILNEYANSEAARQINVLNKKGISTITIGDSSSCTLKARHNCLLVNCARENYRIANTTGAPELLASKCRGIIKNVPYCTKGAQNCSFQAFEAFAVHSAYDINPKDLALMFVKHGLHKITLWLHISTTLYDENLTDPYNFFKVQRIKNKVIFNMCDDSIPYIHDYDTYKKWAHITRISAKDFEIVFETVRRHGPMHTIVALRVEKIDRCFLTRIFQSAINDPDVIFRTVPLADIFNGAYKVPDIRQLVENNFKSTQSELRHFIVPSNVTLALLAYASRASDEGYVFHETATYSSGLKRSIVIGGVSYQDSWLCEVEEYNRIIFSLFILGAVARTDRTKGISLVFNELKNRKFKDTFFGNLIWSMSRWFHCHKESELNKMGSRIWDFNVIPISDITVNGVYKVSVLSDNINTSFSNYNPFEEPDTDDDRDSSGPDNNCEEQEIEEDSAASNSSDDTNTTDSGDSDTTIDNAEITQNPENKDNIVDCLGEWHDIHGNILDFVSFGPILHAVSADAALAAGVALDLKREYPALPDVVRGRNIPHVDIYEDHNNVTIYNAVTKLNRGDKPTIQDIKICVDIVLDILKRNGKKVLVIPSIWSGRDGKDFDSDIKPLFEKFLTEGITIYHIIYMDSYMKKKIARDNNITPKDPTNEAGTCRTTSAPRELSINNSDNLNNFEKDTLQDCDNHQVVAQAHSTPINIPNAHNNGKIPHNFMGGHCAMRAFYEAHNVDMSVHEFITFCSNLLHESYLPPQHVDDYIIRGRFIDTNASATMLGMLAEHFGVRITIHRRGNPIIMNKQAKGEVEIYHNRDHFSSIRGGASDKFSELINTLINGNGDREILDLSCMRVLDVSAAPGYIAGILKDLCKDLSVARYKPGLAMNKQLYDGPLYNYSNNTELYNLFRGRQKFDIIINDAAAPVDSEGIIDGINDIVIKLLSKGGILLIKSFANPHHTWEIAENFKNIWKVDDRSGTSERYFILEGYGEGHTSFYESYDKWNRQECEHKAYSVDHAAFIRDYFVGEFAKYKPTIKATNKVFSFKSITGYASASKTTNAIKMYGTNAVFISPTKYLSLYHQSKGQESFTPHAFFAHTHSNKEYIIIDEISQFPVDYISLVNACYPNHKIVVIGDVHQTPYNDYSRKVSCRKTVKEIGVINSLLDVFKIPVDVCNILNKKHNFRMRTFSDVKNGLCLYTGNIIKFAKSKIPVICYNSLSATELRAKGINAFTVTSYTGSRDHTVVFYIDSASVESQLANKSHVMYTAATRATNQLVVAGDTRYFESYYQIHGTKIMTFEEISGVYLYHHTQLTGGKGLDVTIKEEIAHGNCSTDTAQEIMTNLILPANDPDNLKHSIQGPEIKSVGSCILKTNLDVVAPRDCKAKGYKLPGVMKYAKQQISSNELITVQTEVGRYAKEYAVQMTNDNHNYTYSSLCNGLSKAVYGRDDRFEVLMEKFNVGQEFLSDRLAQYIDKLQEKINKNPGAAHEIKEEFDVTRESLSFFNKYQTKFKADPGFDLSDKVGQGVAAMSKRINIIFGCYARGMLDRLREIMIEERRMIILATHDSEAQLNSTYVRMIQQFDSFDNWSCNDFSEWDASFRKPFVTLTTRILLAMSAPEWIVKFFQNYRDHWTMTYMSKNGRTSLSGREKQFSGNPFTICENTIGNMALCFSIFDYKNFKFAMFKGDDSAVLCDSSKLTMNGSRILNITGHGLKLHNSPVGEFAGWFLTPVGFFPDVVRYTAKFLDKLYRDQEHFDEALKSLQERCRTVRDDYQLNYGVAMCHLYYKGILGSAMIYNEQAIKCLFYFLKNSRRIKFSQLRPVEQEVSFAGNK